MIEVEPSGTVTLTPVPVVKLLYVTLVAGVEEDVIVAMFPAATEL
jgi:hypothetical protein